MKYESVTQKVSFRNAIPAALMSGRKYDVIPKNFLTCIFLGAGLGVTDQFRDLRAHPILYRLSSSCEDTLRTLFTQPVTSLDELKLRIGAATETVTPQMLENTWRESE
jgi:hypothetical protein